MATSYKNTIQKVLQIVSDLRGESSTNTNASRIRAVSRAERDVAKRKFWRLFLLREQTAGTGDGTTTSFTFGTTTYQARDKGLYEIFVGGLAEHNRHQIVDHAQYLSTISQNSNAKIAYQYYDASSDTWKIKVNPAPANGDTVYYSHFWVPAEKTSATESVYCFDPKILAYLAMADIYESEEEPEMALDSLQKAESILGTYESVEETPAINQIYQVGAIENSPRNRGLGTY